MPSDLETRRKMLLFRAQRRGIKELDLVFGAFAAAHLPRLDSAELDRFEALLDVPDWQLYGWIAGHEAVLSAHDNDIYRLLADYRKNLETPWNG